MFLFQFFQYKNFSYIFIYVLCFRTWIFHHYMLLKEIEISSWYSLKCVSEFWWFLAILRCYELCKSSQNWLPAVLYLQIIFYDFFTNMKISKNSTAKYYQNNKERLQKNLVKDTKVLRKKKMKKATISSWTIQKSARRWKRKPVEHRKNMKKGGKAPHYKELLFWKMMKNIKCLA